MLDKLAGEQVDLFVNGQCIAKGDVVVVEDNFGIRITEIMKVNFSTLELRGRLMWSVIFTFAAAVAVIYLSYLCSKYVGKTMNRSSSSLI